MNSSTLFLGAGLTAIIAFITTSWGNIKAICWKGFNLFIECVEVKDYENILLNHMLKTYTKSDLYDKVYESYPDYTTGNKYRQIGYELLGTRSLVFWNGWFPIFFYFNSPKKGDKNNNSSGGLETSPTSSSNEAFTSYIFLRGTFKFDENLKAAYQEYYNMIDVHESSEAVNGRFLVQQFPSKEVLKNGKFNLAATPWYKSKHKRTVSESVENLGWKPTFESPISRLVLPPRVTALVTEIKLWLKSKLWYERKGIPWKRGWLLYGPPGTGKTALTRAIAEELDLPIFIFSLSEMDNLSLIDAWQSARHNAPCIVLLEDIDNVFHGREYIAAKSLMSSMFRPRNRNDSDDDNHKHHVGSGVLSFDVLLNCMDGVNRNEGVFTIVTTNDITKIDPALGLPQGDDCISTRPGRIDKAIELTYMRKEEKRIMAEQILGEYPDLFDKMIKFIESFEGQETPAQFQERCAQIALARYWEEQIIKDSNVILNYTVMENEKLANHHDINRNDRILVNRPSSKTKIPMPNHTGTYSRTTGTYSWPT